MMRLRMSITKQRYFRWFCFYLKESNVATGYIGNAIATGSNPAKSFELDIEPGFTGGVFVG